MEKAKAIELLMKETGWTPTQAASKLGLSNAAVTRSLSLLRLPDAIRKEVESGEIPPSAAYQLAQVVDADKQADLARQVVNKTLTRDGLTGKVQAQQAESNSSSKGRTPSRVSAKLNDGRSVTVNAANLNLSVFIEVLEAVIARARQARSKGLALAPFLKLLRMQSFSEKQP